MNILEEHAISVNVEMIKAKIFPHCIDTEGGYSECWVGRNGERALSDVTELLEAVILNCGRVGEFRTLSTAITSE